MPGFSIDIEKATLKNKNYRKVLHTTKTQQLVLMCLNPGEFIPEEVHKNITQFFRVESGKGVAIVSGKRFKLKDGVSLTVPMGSKHTIKNTSKTDPLKMYTLYSPFHHKPNKVDKRQPFD